MKRTIVHLACATIVIACAASGCGNSRNVERELILTDETLEAKGMSLKNDPSLKSDAEIMKELRSKGQLR